MGSYPRLLERGREVSSEVAANGGGKRAGPVATSILTSLRPAVAARWITARVRQSRIDGARALRADLPDTATPYVFPLHVRDPAASYLWLRSAGIPIFRWDQLWPGTPVLEGDHGVDWSARVIQLGCHQDLSLHDIDAIAATVITIIQS